MNTPRFLLVIGVSALTFFAVSANALAMCPEKQVTPASQQPAPAPSEAPIVTTPQPDASAQPDAVSDQPAAQVVTYAKRSSMDDPVKVNPANPTCDNAGYDLKYPALDKPGSANAKVEFTPQVQAASNVVIPNQALPFTGVKENIIVAMLALSLIFISLGAISFAIADKKAGSL